MCWPSLNMWECKRNVKGTDGDKPTIKRQADHKKLLHPGEVSSCGGGESTSCRRFLRSGNTKQHFHVWNVKDVGKIEILGKRRYLDLGMGINWRGSGFNRGWIQLDVERGVRPLLSSQNSHDEFSFKSLTCSPKTGETFRCLCSRSLSGCVSGLHRRSISYSRHWSYLHRTTPRRPLI